MLKICTVYFKGLYTPDYVSNFYNSIRKHTSVPFQSVCISDTDVEADIVLPYNHYGSIKKHWHKLKFFSPLYGYQNPGDDIIIMDIDQVVVNNIDDILNHKVKDGVLLTYDAWWDNKLGINGGFYKFKSGTLNNIWEKFELNPEYWQNTYYERGIVHKKYYGEQNYVFDQAEDKYSIETVPGEWLFKYTNNRKENLELQKMYCEKYNADYAIMGNVNKKIKIVHFAGPGKTIHQNKEQWIKDNWYE